MPKVFIEYKKLIDAYLQKFFADHGAELSQVPPWGADTATRLLQFTVNGKTIRGGLVLLAAEGYGQTINEDCLKIASAIELIQSGLLIHDDIIDQDRTRRGLKTLYAQFEERAQTLAVDKPTAFGSGMAMCLGDMTFFLAMQLISTVSDSKITQTLMECITKEYAAVCLAQMQDVSFGFSANIPSEEDVITMYRYKTARYSFSLPLMIGAILARAPQKDIHALEKTGENVGIAFQLRDDMLNLFGKEKQTGKPIGSDLREGKKTFVYVTTYQNATKEEQQALKNNPSVAYTLFQKYNIQSVIDKKLESLIREANNNVDNLNITKAFQQHLHDMMSFTVNRTK
jgi:geranylgeranyl diphosphate synthase, type I